MNDPHPGHDPLDDLTEEFARRWRGGERPSVESYAKRYPQWADEIRDVLPGVLLMEQLKPRREDAVPTGIPAQCHDPPPERVGEYRVIREIGRGGMGVVYEAEHEALGRRVAIKLLPRHLLANEKLRSRFRRESHLAARLHHTNIVPVFGVGESGEYCFYVMQLIDGRGLDQVIRDAATSGGGTHAEAEPDKTLRRNRSSAAAGGAADQTPPDGSPEAPGAAPPAVLAGSARRESYRTAARIGIQVADALAYAHTQGVLHRDIKPSNLLLDGGGAVWVTDFGVAKVLEEANLTQSGEFVGTLKYMPPERFSGQSDARGDVYSLGVTLYEMLTLRPAFPDATPQHLIQLITQEAPIRPRTWDPDVPADLETIVLKAAARDPAHRYQTPGELAGDLRRFLDDRPILARRAGPVDQAWRWCRRNPALAAVTAAAFLLMVLVTVVSVVANAKTAAANRETALANRDMENALAAEKAQREYAESTSNLALEALNRIYNRFTLTPLIVAPQAPNEQGDVLPPQPALPPEAVALMNDLLRTYQQIALSGGKFPKLQAQAAEANHRIGDICQRLVRFNDAAAAYRTAIELYTQLAPDAAPEAMRIKLARTYNELGRTLRALRQFDEAKQMHERAISTLADAPEAFTGRPECRYELARSYYTLGERDMSLFKHGLGLDPPAGPPPKPNGDHPARRAAALLEQLVQEFPAVPEYRHLLACCYRDMPPEKPGRGGPPANLNTDRALDLLRQLVADFPKVPDYRFDLCETLGRPTPPARPGDWDANTKARERLEEAVALATELAAQYANVPGYTAAHARYLGVLGTKLLEAGKLSDADKQLRKAVALQARLVKQYPEVVAFAYWLSMMERSLARAMSDRGELKAARARLEAAAGRMEALRKKEPGLEAIRSFLGNVYRDLAHVLTRSGETSLAAEVLRKAEEFVTDQTSPHPFGPPHEWRRDGK